ncbi:hypothetical protein [Herbidospora daliensis]|uniref:hypothetical protein n=1 Tax=Herbidospora daliensis TaxID=295585 RepID=UPI000784AEE9|nr:hypothetical protein [Herbidospora daliensis]
MIEMNPPLARAKPFFRIAMAVVVGIVLPALLLAGVSWLTNNYPESQYCGHYTGCFGYLVLAFDVGRWIAVVLAWPLLHLLRVRPALPVAALATLFLIAIWQVALAMPLHLFFESIGLIIVSGVIAYPVAAWLAMPHISRKVLIVAVAFFFALYACALAYGFFFAE